MKMGMAQVPRPLPLPSDRIWPTWAATATRRTKGKTRLTGAYSLVSLFFLLPTLRFFSLISFPVISFAPEHNDELGGTGRPPSLARDRANTGCDSDAEDKRAVLTGTYSFIFLFSLLPTLHFFSLFFFQVISRPRSTTMSWTGSNRNTGPDRKATGAYSVVVVFKSVYSLLFFFLPYSSLLLP